MNDLMQTPSVITVLIADDHPIIRSAIKALIASVPDMDVVGDAKDGESVVSMYEQLKPDITLMDLNMPKKGGIEALNSILTINPDARVIILTNSDNSDEIMVGIEAGACGYLLKDTPQGQLIEVIRMVHAGQVYLSKDLAARVALRTAHKALTGREIQILSHVMTGKNNQLIGLTLGISESTVKTHLKNILLKLGVNDRTQAVRKALQLGLLKMDKP